MNETEKPDEAQSEVTEESGPIFFSEFLESSPPSQTVKVTNLHEIKFDHGNQFYELKAPQLKLHCEDAHCSGIRFFRFKEGSKNITKSSNGLTFLTYICSNCQRTHKIFSLFVNPEADGSGTCYKFGEYPLYGSPTPPRLLRLFEKERETYLKGRRCENQGLGIGAFVYYRRVVENQKNRILDEIIKVSKKVGVPAEMLQALDNAMKETQFQKALSSVKDAVAQVLLINGHNPLTLLHSALSGGLHKKTDEECLELAHTVRVVLVELAERLGQALKDEAELNTAITRLLQTKHEK